MYPKHFLTVLLLCGLAMAQNPLAGLPSSPGAHIAQIQAMGDNEWLNLGKPADDPQWGQGRGRSWGAYAFAYAPDLGGAFFNGQGVHGYIKPDGHYMDDIYFYDINRNRWICLYPGMDTQNFFSLIQAGNLKMRDDGQLIDGGGKVVPFTTIVGHIYQEHAYDPDLHLYVTVEGGSGMGGDQYTQYMQWYIDGKALLQAQMAGKTDSVSGTPFFFNAVTGLFERPHFLPVIPNQGQAEHNVFYLPTIKKLLHYNGPYKITRLGDYASKRWVSAGATGTGPTGIDFGGCYDSKRARIYLGAGDHGPDSELVRIYSYDVATNAWTSHNVGRTFSNSNHGIVLYDSVNDRVLDLAHGSGSASISVLNPETWTWEETITVPTGGMNQYACWHGFYSPALNAHFIYLAVDSDNNGVMWAYRYKRGSNKVEAKAKAEARGGISVSPNPSKGMVHINYKLQIANYELKGINLAVYDIHGRCVKNLTDKIHNSSFEICNLSGLPAGIYVAQVSLNGKTFSKRMVLTK